MQDPSIEDFRPWLGHGCTLSVAGTAIPVTLKHVEELAGSVRDKGGFRLEFAGPADPVLAQAIMQVDGPDASYEIFLVPIGRTPEAARYEAIFY